MADEIDTEIIEQPEVAETPAPEANADPLDAIINKALDGETTDDAEQGDDRTRDEKGRFAKKDSEAETAPADGTSEQPAVSTSTEQPPNAQAEPISEGHFRGWSPEQREAFGKLPPEAQKIALDVVKSRDSFYGEKLEQWQRFGQATEPLVNAVKPHVDRIRQVTDDPSAYVKQVLDVDYRLQFAPYAEKVQLLGQLAKSIGVPFAAPQADPFADPTSLGGEAYPVIHDLRTQLAQVQSQLGAYKQQHESYLSQQASSQITSFAAQKNADGTPKYPHFELVKGAMGQLMNSGQVKSLDEAYAAAVKPIQDAVAADLAARQRAADEAQKAAVAKARKALPVRSSGIAPGGKTQTRGLDAVLNSALDAAGIQ